MANLILSIFERVITILMFIALAVALVCKKKSKKVPLFIIRPIFLVGLLFIMFQAVFVQRNFSSLDKAIRAYDIKAKPIANLQDEKSTYVIMDNEGTVEGKIFPESSGKWKLPDSIFYGTGREYQDVKINIDMSTIEINGEWYVLVAPNDDNYVIADVKDSVGTKFLEIENNKNEKICYGYMEHKPKDYWISVNGEKISLD